MRPLFVAFLMYVLPISASILEISKSTDGPIYQGVPFKGVLKISSYPENESTLKKHFSDIKSRNFLYIVKSLNTNKTMDSLEIIGVFSLFSLPENVTINTKTYEFRPPENKFVPLVIPQSIISLDHNIENGPWYFSWPWICLFSLVIFFLFYLLWKIILKAKFKKDRIKQANEIILIFKKSQSRREFEAMYLQRKNVHNAFALKSEKNPLNETPIKLNKFFKKIEKKLYIRQWNTAFLKELVVMRDKI